MKNSTSIIIIFLIIFAALGAFFVTKLAKSPKQLNFSNQTRKIVPDSQNLNQTEGTLLIKSTPTTTNVGDIIRFSVNIESSALLTGVQTTLLFNPQSLNIESIAPGSLLTKPEILINTVDQAKGVISYAIGTFTPTKAYGEVFIVTATVLSKNTPPRLSFDQTKTKVAFIDEKSQQPVSETETHINFIENQ